MTNRPWRFYGREVEMARLRAAFLAPQFALVAVPGRRCVGKSRLLQETVRGLPEDRPAFLFRASPWEDPEDLQRHLEDALGRARRKRPGIGRALDSAGDPLRGLPQVLESLLRRGVGVAIDDAHYLLSDKLPGLALEIAAMARSLRREAPGPEPGLLSGGRRGALVLAGWDQPRMRDLLAALGADPGSREPVPNTPDGIIRAPERQAPFDCMPLEPWPAATLAAIARDRGWLDRPRRLALVRAALGGMPMEWDYFSSDALADFAAWPDDGEWRQAFARLVVDKVEAWDDLRDWRAIAEEDMPVLEHIARSPEGEAGAGALRAAFPHLAQDPRSAPDPQSAPDRLEARLTALSEKRLPLEAVPAFPGAEGASEARWRIFDTQFRFWIGAGMQRTFDDWLWRDSPAWQTGRLAARMEAMEETALAQLKRDCGADWPAFPGRDPGQAAEPVRPLPRTAVPIERRASAFAVTAPGVLEGVLVPYGVPVRVGEAPGSGPAHGFEEVFEPGCLEVNGLLVTVTEAAPDPRGRPLARPGRGLELRDGPGGLHATVTLPDTIDGRRVRARVEAGDLTAFSTAFQAIEEEWPAPPAPPDRRPGQAPAVPGDRRIVRRARLVGLALTDRPEHHSPFADEPAGG